jgi:transcriptional regulator GlxA family with amidase domain
MNTGKSHQTELLFLLLPGVHVLDLAGPVQVFYEANGLGAGYRLRYCGVDPTVTSSQGLAIAELEPPGEVGPHQKVFVPGIDSTTVGDLDHAPIDWLQRAHAAGATVCSICSGAFVLARAGLLDGRHCTTHWRVADRLREECPRARLSTDRLFVRDGNVVTSAGVTSGIDMALSLVEEDHGPLMVARVAREIVVYLRRNGDNDPNATFLDYRSHIHPGIHRVQDRLMARPDRKPTIDELARVAGMSPRHLTRTFRKATGITLKSFANRVKLEVAGNLLQNPVLTVDEVAARCGFKDPRQLRRLWQSRFGTNPSASRVRTSG